MKQFKKILSLCLMAMFVVVGVTGCGCEKKNTDKEIEKEKVEETYNTNQGVIEDKEVGGLKLTNTSLVSTEYNSTLVTSVTNNTSENIKVGIFNIYVKDKDGNQIVKLIGYVGGEVPAGETREITSNVDMNLDNAYTVDYEIVNE